MAEHDPTTPSRRRILGASVALLFAAPAADAAKPAEQDAELLDACARFYAADAACAACPSQTDEQAMQLDALNDLWFEALTPVCALQPRTPAGLQAKAGVAYVALWAQIGSLTVELLEEHSSQGEWIALQVLRDVAGRAAA